MCQQTKKVPPLVPKRGPKSKNKIGVPAIPERKKSNRDRELENKNKLDEHFKKIRATKSLTNVHAVTSSGPSETSTLSPKASVTSIPNNKQSNTKTLPTSCLRKSVSTAQFPTSSVLLTKISQEKKQYLKEDCKPPIPLRCPKEKVAPPVPRRDSYSSLSSTKSSTYDSSASPFAFACTSSLKSATTTPSLSASASASAAPQVPKRDSSSTLSSRKTSKNYDLHTSPSSSRHPSISPTSSPSSCFLPISASRSLSSSRSSGRTQSLGCPTPSPSYTSKHYSLSASSSYVQDSLIESTNISSYTSSYSYQKPTEPFMNNNPREALPPYSC